MKRVCLLLALLISSTQCMAANVVLNLQNYGDLIIINVINMSQENIKVSRLFTENPGFGLVEFFVIVDGRRVGPLTPPNENFPVASDYIDLPPLDAVGKAFYISEIRRRYRVGNGCFNLTVEYHDVMAKKFDAYSKEIESNKIHVCK